MQSLSYRLMYSIKLKICCVVPKKIHFEVVRFEPKHPIVSYLINNCIHEQINSCLILLHEKLYPPIFPFLKGDKNLTVT